MEESMADIKKCDDCVDKKKCIGCGTCVSICPVEAISFDENGKAKIDKEKCIRCGACQASCPVEAIKVIK